MSRYGIEIIGTSYEALDLAEDRGRFSTLLKDINIPYPKFDVATNADEALDISDELGFPILVRPSYVLGGQGMKIVINKEELQRHVINLFKEFEGNRVLLDHYLDGAIEAEADAICDGEDAYIIGIMEHIEPCGIHSGDSSAVLPPFNLGPLVMEQIKEHTINIAKALDTKGLINIQFAIKDDVVYIIEANPRASRTVPFICKAYGEPYVNYATKVMLGTKKVKDFDFNPQMDGFAIKIPVFSFSKFPNVNKKLGPEMKSTGEEIRFIKDLKDPVFKKLHSERSCVFEPLTLTGFKIPAPSAPDSFLSWKKFRCVFRFIALTILAYFIFRWLDRFFGGAPAPRKEATALPAELARSAVV